MISKLLVAAGLLTASASAFAISTPLNITIDGGLLVTALPVTDMPGVGDSDVYSWLSADITAYDTMNPTAHLPGPVGTGASHSALSKVDTSGTSPSSINLSLTDTYDYIFLHWGGKNGGWGEAFYIGGLSGNFEFDAPPGGHPDVGGLSSYAFYGPNPSTKVPDGGNTVLMLGVALCGMFAVQAASRKVSLAKVMAAKS